MEKQRETHGRMLEQLLLAEQAHKQALFKLEDEKRNHGEFMKKSDEFTNLLEQERERSEPAALQTSAPPLRPAPSIRVASGANLLKPAAVPRVATRWKGKQSGWRRSDAAQQICVVANLDRVLAVANTQLVLRRNATFSSNNRVLIFAALGWKHSRCLH